MADVLERPRPPAGMAHPLRHPEGFVEAPEVLAWIRGTFINRGAPLFNPEHGHLTLARIGVLWTNAPNARHMRGIAGTAEVPVAQGGRWQKARAAQQLREWFGTDNLDFLITLDAVYSDQASDASFCALVEHELYHCAQARDEYGAPKFRKSGRPVYGIRGHDVEEFTGIVRRYGVGPTGHNLAEMVKVAGKKPEVAEAAISLACGTCKAGV